MDKKTIHQEVTENILALLERGTLPWRRPWATSGGDSSPVPVNAISRRPYHGINRLILWAAALVNGYPSHAWATFRQVQGAGGHIRKGEHGTHVVLYRPVECKRSEAMETPEPPAESGEETIADPERTPCILRAFTVFNLAQCDGLPQPEAPAAPPFDPIPAAQRFQEAIGATARQAGRPGEPAGPQDRARAPAPDRALRGVHRTPSQELRRRR